LQTQSDTLAFLKYHLGAQRAATGGVVALGRMEPRLTRGRLLISPYGLAGSRWELLVAGLCISLIGVVYLIEILTPDDYVVSDLALLPLLAAVWVLSGRLVALVGFVAALLFVAEVSIDAANRTTVIVIGATVVVTVLTVRLYATSLASLLSGGRHLRPPVPDRSKAMTLDAIDRSSRGVRSLTRRELDVVRLAVEGYTAGEIGRHLHIGNRTVETHLASAYSKLRIHSKGELIRMASRLGMPVPDGPGSEVDFARR
jgi:DNA-binding CsgD family transcriptional regulator